MMMISRLRRLLYGVASLFLSIGFRAICLSGNDGLPVLSGWLVERDDQIPRCFGICTM